MKVDHTVFGDISEMRLAEISRYGRKDITTENFSDPAKWMDLKHVLIYHPDPITRHEASFVIGELSIPLFEYLVSVVKYDRSIVAKHEAAEALGRAGRYDAYLAFRFLRKITENKQAYDTEVSHPDVQSTAHSSIRELEERFCRMLLGSNPQK